MIMTNEEAIAMLGTEFTYVYEDGDTIPAYVKAIDIEKGRLTCYTLATKTDSGWVSIHSTETPDGTWCVIGVDGSLSDCKIKLQGIKNTGIYVTGGTGVFTGCAFGQ